MSNKRKVVTVSLGNELKLVSVTPLIERIDYRTPMKFGGRVVRDVTLLHVKVECALRDGGTVCGFGSMTMGNAWGWPSQRVESVQTLEAMLDFANRVAGHAVASADWADPLTWSHQLQGGYDALAGQTREHLGLSEAMPRLACLVAASPLDAAMHDAWGRRHGASSFACLGSEQISRDLSAFLSDEFRGEYLDRYTRKTPKAELPLYHLIGALDPLTSGDLEQRLGDGLPETLEEWIVADGLDHLKVKLAGDDLTWDLDRVASIDEVCEATQAKRQVASWVYSLDFNEKCPDVGYVLEFLEGLAQRRPRACERIQYIEQPMHRDMTQGAGASPVHELAKIKPVVIDESLVDFESVLRAKELGYSGVALKACKGQSESLLMAAAAQKFGMFLCVQDLTCVGASFLHSASLAAHIDPVAAIEGNGRQYCPAGNASWEDRYPGMFRIETGRVATGELAGIGLGFETPDWSMTS